MVISKGEYELATLMKEPIPKDWGNFVLSPMPGTLISFAVKVRQIISFAVKVRQIIKSISYFNVF
jgi:hypothetical protein